MELNYIEYIIRENDLREVVTIGIAAPIAACEAIYDKVKRKEKRVYPRLSALFLGFSFAFDPVPPLDSIERCALNSYIGIASYITVYHVAYEALGFLFNDKENIKDEDIY